MEGSLDFLCFDLFSHETICSASQIGMVSHKLPESLYDNLSRGHVQPLTCEQNELLNFLIQHFTHVLYRLLRCLVRLRLFGAEPRITVLAKNLGVGIG